MSAGQVVRVGEVNGSEQVVMFDIDGGLVDLSEFAHLLTGNSEGSRRQARQRFFEQAGQAAVIDSGRAPVEAVAGLGFVPVYSTTTWPGLVLTARQSTGGNAPP